MIRTDFELNKKSLNFLTRKTKNHETFRQKFEDLSKLNSFYNYFKGNAIICIT